MSLADARIRRFSAITWLTGSVAAIVVALLTMPFLGVNPDTGGLIFTDPNRYELRPWENPDIGELEIVDDEIVGTADGGWIDLPAGDALWVIGPVTEGGENYTNVYQQLDAGVSVTVERPEYIGLISDGRDQVIFPGRTGGRLWFAPRLTDWKATVTLEEPTPFGGPTVSGEGPALLVYDGEALSGRFTFTGDGFFTVDAIVPGAVTELVEGVDDVDQRASWVTSDTVVLRVDVDDGAGSWTITLDQPASTP
ncbi:hypothetical protein BKA24_000182 [Microbacterium marinum]|uniref:Uncharacterized protein n=1 Tax=Microbacterium marinum TaxID=421115 RepID=A0A7W7BMN5_9MICO|nr:hypothetical protein [Microbacterium marinum]